MRSRVGVECLGLDWVRRCLDAVCSRTITRRSLRVNNLVIRQAGSRPIQQVMTSISEIGEGGDGNSASTSGQRPEATATDRCGGAGLVWSGETELSRNRLGIGLEYSEV